jgi:hypothetical protein
MVCRLKADSCSANQALVLLANSSPSVLLPTAFRFTPPCTPHTFHTSAPLYPTLQHRTHSTHLHRFRPPCRSFPSITTSLPFAFSDKCHLLSSPHPIRSAPLIKTFFISPPRQYKHLDMKYRSIMTHNIARLWLTISLDYDSRYRSIMTHNIARLWLTISLDCDSQYRSIMTHNIARLW